MSVQLKEKTRADHARRAKKELTEAEKAALKVCEFDEAQQALREFINDYPSVFSVFYELVDKYNATFNEAKGSIKEIPGTDKFSIGQFKRSAPPESIAYTAEELPDHILLMPGVVKDVDTKAIDALILSGEISSASVSRARHVKLGTPKITGPKEVTISLG